MNQLVEMKNRQATTTSLIVAESFNKKHLHIMRDIRNLKEELGQSKNGLTKFKEMFQESLFVTTQNKKQPMYIINRDGFMLLVMGFSGKKALKIKLLFIEAFNKMEEYIRRNEIERLNKLNGEWLLSRNNGKLTRRAETDIIAVLIEYAKEQGSKSPEKYYIHYSKLVNSTVGIGSGQRETADIKTLNTIALLEDLISHTILTEINKTTKYKEIYQICKNRCADFMQYIYLGNRLEYAS